MSDSLDMDPDDCIELLNDLEHTFAIRFGFEEPARFCTVGDLHQAIVARTPRWEEHRGTCASSFVFYRVRRALAPSSRAALSPDTPLAETGLTSARLIAILRKQTGLRFPALRMAAIGTFGLLLSCAGVLAVPIGAFRGEWATAGIALLTLLLGLWLCWIDPARLPRGVVTIGDLVERTVPLNPQTLAEAGVRRPDRWSVLVALLSEVSMLPAHRIEPDTFLLPERISRASASG